MKDFLLTIGNILNLKNLENLNEQQLKATILEHLRKKATFEKSLFELSEDFTYSTELAVKIFSSLARSIEKIYSEEDIYSFIFSFFDEFIKIVPAENISYMEKHPRRNCLVLKVASGKIKLKNFKKRIFSIENSLAGRVFKEEKFIYIPDIKKDKRFNSKLSHLPISSVLSVPVKIKNKVAGVINFSQSKTDAFDETTIFLFVTMAQFFSCLLTLFKYYRESLKYNKMLQKEIDNKTKEIQKINRKFYKLAITDPLTELYNRRFFFQRLEEEFARALRYGNNFCLVLFDLDNLKKVNDMFGHPEGDKLIKTFGKLVKSNKRKEDIIGRLGGDEFGCILIGATSEGAKKFAERIKEDIKEKYTKIPVTASASVGCLGRGVSFKFYRNYMEFYKIVDKLLLQAKRTKDTVLVLSTETK